MWIEIVHKGKSIPSRVVTSLAGAEKRNIYTFGGTSETATCADEITVELPESWDLCENCFGQPLLEAPRGTCYLINEVLGGDKHPYIIVRDPDFKLRRFELKEI